MTIREFIVSSNLSIEDKKPLDGQIGGLNAMIFFANQKTTLKGESEHGSD